MENKLLNKLKNKVSKYGFIIKPVIYISIIFAIAISAIIRANFNYKDDLRRVAIGYMGWSNYSRYLSSFLSFFMHTDLYLTDISPLPQLIAVCMMALAGVIILYVYKESKSFSIMDIIAIIPLGLSPFFLECFSYKYDAPYMALSVLISVFPLLFRKKNNWIYSSMIIISTLIMCMTYQASSGIFLMLVLLIGLKKWNECENIKETLKFLAISFGSYLGGLLIFKLFMMKPADTYVSNKIIPIAELIPKSVENFKEYFSLILSWFKKEWIILVVLIGIFFVYVYTRDSKRKKYFAFPISIIGLILMLLLSFGMYPFLTKPLFAPRSMYGFGVFIALIGVAISTSKKAYIGKLSVIILSWIFFVFSFTYGNALEVQKQYTDFRVNLVIDDLNDLEVMTTNKIKGIQITGSIGISPILRNMPQDYQMLNNLVPVQFKGNWDWGEYYFYNYFDLKNIKKSYNLKTYDLPILKDTMYHTIKGNDKYILIELK